MPSLDTNLLLRWLLDDVPQQRGAVDELLESTDTYHVADVALVEVAFVLERVMGFSRALVADFLAAVLTLRAVALNRPLWQRAVADYRAHPKLSIADCVLAADAAVTGNDPLYTFDRKLGGQLDNAELLGT